MQDQLQKNLQVLKEIQAISLRPLQPPKDDSLPHATTAKTEVPPVAAFQNEDAAQEFCTKFINKKVAFVIALLTALTLLLTFFGTALQIAQLYFQIVQNLTHIPPLNATVFASPSG